MAELNLKKLSRAELLEMMIGFSEEAEACKKREAELTAQFERERMSLQQQMADERAQMLKDFDEETAEMRAKFNEQKAQMQEKFDKDIAGLKARQEKEKKELQDLVDLSLVQIKDSGNLAEAVASISGIMESAQKAADMYVKTLQERAQIEYEDFQRHLAEAQKKVEGKETVTPNTRTRKTATTKRSTRTRTTKK